MSFLMKSADDLAASCMTLGAIGGDLYDLATLAAGLVALLRPSDDLNDDEPAALNQQRMACMVAAGVERAALAMGHLQLDVSSAPLTALRAIPADPAQCLQLIPARPCAGMMLTADEASGLVALRALLEGKAVPQ